MSRSPTPWTLACYASILTGADPGFVHRGGGDFERSERRAKRETSEASKKQLGVRGKPPWKILKFRASESESERSLTNYFLFFGVLFY